MRILVVQNMYPPHASGGYGDLCEGTVDRWLASGHEVLVVTSTMIGDGATVEGQPHVRRVLPMYWEDHRVLRPGWRESLRRERTSRSAIVGYIEEFQPDVISAWNMAALSFGVLDESARRGLPSVLVLGDTWLDFGIGFDAWNAHFVGRVRPLLAPAVSALTGVPAGVAQLGSPVVACFASSYLRDHARGDGRWGLDHDAVVPHGLDRARYPVEPATAVDRPWRGRLLFVGRLAPEKGLETAVRALHRLPDASLDVVGDGDLGFRSRVVELIDDLGLAERVHLHDAQGPGRLREFYDQADALLFPSEWDEPFGIVPLEAMARGVPVVASGTGGSGEFLVDGRTAIVFEAGSAEGLATGVRRLSDDKPLRASLRSSGLGVARWLDRAVTSDELLAWHAWAAAGCTGDRPAERSLLPPELASRRQ